MKLIPDNYLHTFAGHRFTIKNSILNECWNKSDTIHCKELRTRFLWKKVMAKFYRTKQWQFSIKFLVKFINQSGNILSVLDFKLLFFDYRFQWTRRNGTTMVTENTAHPLHLYSALTWTSDWLECKSLQCETSTWLLKKAHPSFSEVNI